MLSPPAPPLQGRAFLVSTCIIGAMSQSNSIGNTFDNTTENIHAANGRRGAGAKSPEGLARSAKNATKHGLSSHSFCLLSNEDPSIFAQHQAAMIATLAPRNPLELELVGKIVESKWLMTRVTEIETRVLSGEVCAQRAERFAAGALPSGVTREATLIFLAMESLETRSKTFANLGRYRATHERAYYRALNTLQKLRGGPKSLATDAWPELPTAPEQETATQFREPPPQPPAPTPPPPAPQPPIEPVPPPTPYPPTPCQPTPRQPTPCPLTPCQPASALQNEAPAGLEDFTPRE